MYVTLSTTSEEEYKINTFKKKKISQNHNLIAINNKSKDIYFVQLYVTIRLSVNL